MNQYMAQDPRGALAKASYLARRGEIDRAFALLDKEGKSFTPYERASSALEAFRQAPTQATPERTKKVEEWIKAGNEGGKGKFDGALELLLAELYEFEGRYDEATKIYRARLADNDANAVQKAIVKNNLAFLLAISKNPKSEAKEAVDLTQQAIQVLGPTSDLLDTRGLAYLAAGNMQDAIADLRLAADDSPSIAKLFHLAQAEKQANNLDAARKALAKAEELGLSADRFSPREREIYTQLAKELQ